MQGTLVLSVVIAYEVVRRLVGPERSSSARRRLAGKRRRLTDTVWERRHEPAEPGHLRRRRRRTAGLATCRGGPGCARGPAASSCSLPCSAFAAVIGVTDTPDLTPADLQHRGAPRPSPILLAGLGGLFAERAGIVNIGLEGMMVLGTWFAGCGGWQFGPW